MLIRRISILLLFTPLLIALTWGVVEAKKQNPHKDQPKTWVDVPAYRGSGGPAYVAYGDSITHGYGSTLPYPSLRTWQLEQDAGTGLSLYNNGVNGYWSGQLVNLLKSSAARARNRQSRFITVSIGYNEMSLA